MKFTCEKAILVSAIAVASRTVAVKSAISALEGILVKADQHLTLTGFNLETGITVKAGAEIEEPGECVFPARLFFDIVRKLPDELVYVSVDANCKVSIRGGISSFTISAMEAEDYPELPDVETEKGVAIPQQALREMISGTIFSVSENQARPIHTGCLFEVADDAVTMVAVDGFRLARRTWHTAEPIGRTMKFVVPAAALKELEKILDDTDTPVIFTLGRKHILFEVGDATLVCRILEGEFLDWRRVVPTQNPILLVANVAALTDSVERVSLIVSEKLKSPVRCLFGENTADFSTTTTIGAAKDSCAIAGDGKELEIGFNCRYLLEALRAVPTQEVTLELSNALSPIVLTPVGEQYDYAYMVLPVRLKAGE
jgi:DNA polymerase-3 subunit beta